MKTRLSTPEEAFQELLEGNLDDAPVQLRRLVKVSQALEPERLSGPSADFRRRVRDQIAAAAAIPEEERFARAVAHRVVRLDDEEVAPLARLASALEPSRLPLPSPAFRYQLRSTLVALATRPQPLSRRVAIRISELNGSMRRSLRVVGATGLGAAMLLSSGAAMAAAHNALPGDALYGLKRLQEQAQLVPISGKTEGFRHLDFARTRLSEVRGLNDRGSKKQVLYVDTLGAMDKETGTGAAMLIVAFRQDGQRAAMDRLTAFANVQTQDIAALVDRLPPAARPAARASLATAERVAKRAEDVLSGCPCPANVFVPPSVSKGPGSDAAVACECKAAGNSQTDSAQAPPDSGSKNPPPTHTGGDTGGDSGGGDPGTGKDKAVNPPDVPGTTVDNTIEDIINNLLDNPPAPLPTPSTPAIPPLP